MLVLKFSYIYKTKPLDATLKALGQAKFDITFSFSSKFEEVQ